MIKPNFIYIFHLIGILLLLNIFSACDKAEYETKKFFGLDAGSNRHIDIFVDVTDSRRLNEEIPKDKEFISSIIEKLETDDLLEVYFIHSRTFSRLEKVYEARMPAKPGPRNINSKKAHEKFKNDFQTAWDIGIKNVTQKKLYTQTDLIGAFLFLRDHKIKSVEHSVVILSDMLAYKPKEWNFEKDVPDVSLLEQWERKKYIPDFSNITFFVYGSYAEGISNDHYMGVKNFWEEYFKLSGGVLACYQYQRESSSIIKE